MDAEIDALMKHIRSLGPVRTGPVTLSEEYLRLVDWVESLPENQDGSDKSWLWRAVEMDREHFAKARPA